jgi:feruloyl esterase
MDGGKEMKPNPALALLVIVVALLIVMVCLTSVPSQAQAKTERDASTRCKALRSEDFSQVIDAPTQIMEAKLVDASNDTPKYCQVSGYVAPNLEFLLRLPPDAWNGKFIEVGCGGFCGNTDQISECDEPLRRGYACIVSDNGHKSTTGDAKWAYDNLPGEIDQGYRGAHVTALAGKAIVEHNYHQTTKKSYFIGGSTGGRQALMEAQRFPWDFDGIIAGCPSLGVPEFHMTLLWNDRALLDDTGKSVLGETEIGILHEAVVAKCDMNDGIKDGLIGDPRKCAFDPMELQCTAKKVTGCLTPKQLVAVQKIYSGPVTSTGDQIYMPGAMKGSEKTWLGWFSSAGANFAAEQFRYSGFYPNYGPTWKPEDFDFDRDYKRLGIAESFYTSTNPDLRRFKAAGGKLLSYVGWSDGGGMPLPGIDYYETVEKTMGGRAATQDFFRLFAIPGMNHCSGGDGAFAVDWLSALEAWVDKGEPPARLMGFHVRLEDLRPDASNYRQEMQRRLKFPLDSAHVEFSRPVYPYPITVKYLGHGDSKDAVNFVPAEP